ncbi:SOS response-associated peptidase [Alcaligenaceae bacterium B3P038]|nr:SOS response-associated peptidase [Alcaligenaceae bacterium B3P038]
MCGRIAQSRAVDDYLETIAWNSFSLPDALDPRYNVPPDTKPLAFHCLAGDPEATRLFWGYKPVWSKRAAVSNARIDTILNPESSFWRTMFTHGRILVPADGWYEWTADKGSKQPWFFHSEGDEPVMMAAICSWRPGAETDAEHGMAIVTDDSAGGMVDIHDRRPVVLPPALARVWADPATTTEQARGIIAAALPSDAFRWHKVRTEVGSSRYQLPDAMEKVSD